MGAGVAADGLTSELTNALSQSEDTTNSWDASSHYSSGASGRPSPPPSPSPSPSPGSTSSSVQGGTKPRSGSPSDVPHVGRQQVVTAVANVGPQVFNGAIAGAAVMAALFVTAACLDIVVRQALLAAEAPGQVADGKQGPSQPQQQQAPFTAYLAKSAAAAADKVPDSSRFAAGWDGSGAHPSG